MINLLPILWITVTPLGSFLVGNTRPVQAHTSLDKAPLISASMVNAMLHARNTGKM
jgi:hypothetical protein